MRYTEESVEKVKNADIVATISNFRNLKKTGSNYKCLSFFTEEKTPSFVVSSVKQCFKCFSSGTGGDGISFVMQYKNAPFIEAVEIIAKIHNISLEKENISPEEQRKYDQKSEMYDFVSQSSKDFVKSYKQLSPNHWGKELISDRNFDSNSLILFEIGYNDILGELTKKAISKATLNIAKEVGLSKTKNNHSSDVFSERIIFPIHNEKGGIVGFGGRQSNHPNLNKAYKYINSKDSLIYNKSHHLYGLFQSKKKISDSGIVILTEGYTDVISMHQNGCGNTVASCGIGLTKPQALLLKKYAKEVILFRDGDEAGLKAMLKKGGDMDICLSHDLKVSICILPDNEDPDSFSRSTKYGNIFDWINKNKKDAIHYKVSHFDLVRDTYNVEIKEIKEAYTLLKADENSNIIDLNGLGKKALKDAGKVNNKIAKNILALKKEEAFEILDIVKIDPYKKATAVKEIVEILCKIKNEILRAEYIKQISKFLGIATATLKLQIGTFEIAQQKLVKKEQEKDGTLFSSNNIVMPEGGDMKEYLEFGFLTIGNQFWFLVNGTFIKGSDFKFEPLFQVMGNKENKRLAEVTNTANQKKIIEFDSEILSSFSEFRRFLFKLNGFLFYTDDGIRSTHFDRFVRRFNRQFQPALELLTMGQNTKDFYAFANGVFWKNQFRSVNKFGIINLEGIGAVDSDYNQKIDNYYSPAFSEMHKDNQNGDDLYENDRYFIYKESAISLEKWMDQMQLVFQDKGTIGILFNFAALFRDLFLKNYDYFPLLGGFGEKDSGKSGFGKILQNFFYYRLPAIDLTQATHVGLSRRLTRNVNTVHFGDEYKDRTIKEEVANLLMGVWNANGREKGKGVGTTRTTLDKINSALYYAGQFMPTFNENALSTRTILLFFVSKNFSAVAKSNYNKLLNVTNTGISSLIIEIIQHRAYFEKKLILEHSKTEEVFKNELKNEDYQQRTLDNISMLFTTYSILKDKIKFPFSEKKLLKICKEIVRNNSEQISDSNGLSDFWNILTYLYENSIIKEDREFIVENNLYSLEIIKKRKPFEYKNPDGSQLLFLRLKSVYQYYNKEITSREGLNVINETTLRHYFKSTPYFIGLVAKKTFGSAKSQSCYAFDYTQMLQKGLITLEPKAFSDNNFGGKNQKQSELIDYSVRNNSDDVPY